MASKKIDRDFVLSDSRVNVYGFRLCTDGYVMDEFLKNPIGYYGHEKEDGVLLRWEEVRTEGDMVLGKPVINLDHPRAERTIQEIEDGFLNAASLGGIVVLEYHLEDGSGERGTNHPQPILKTGGEPAEQVLVVDKWYNKECSLVDSPGNRDAFKIELMDREERGITVKDLVDESGERAWRVYDHPRPLLKTGGEVTDGLKSDMNMKKVTLSISPELVTLLNLGDADDEGSVLAGIKDLHDTLIRKDANIVSLQNELDVERKSTRVKEVKAILDKGLSDGKFTAATRSELEGQFAGNPVALKKLVDTMQPYKAITDRLNIVPADLRDLADKSYDDLDKANKLQFLKEQAPDVYAEKYRAKFGKEAK